LNFPGAVRVLAAMRSRGMEGSAGMYPAKTIARWLIAWAEADEDPLTNMKLQKLLYYAQGQYLARCGEPLFGDAIEAWSHGPVVPSVYREFKGYGARSIELADTDPFQWSDVSPEIADFLSTVWNTYGGYSAGRLRNMTHNEPPWQRSFAGDGERGTVIPLESMRTYFKQLAAVSEVLPCASGRRL
jgi:uncharacterized phage-associated protein